MNFLLKIVSSLLKSPLGKGFLLLSLLPQIEDRSAELLRHAKKTYLG
jgi:hypothetical protein